jgi:predicted GH43/DUF377 family glycosyl hydrolase
MNNDVIFCSIICDNSKNSQRKIENNEPLGTSDYVVVFVTNLIQTKKNMTKYLLPIAICITLASCNSGESKHDQTKEKDSTNNLFAWQLKTNDTQKAWENYSYSTERWWGTFPKDLPATTDMYKDNPWAIGPIIKHSGNPVLSPAAGAWDQGCLDGGGVHNGSIIVKDDVYYYVYRGDRPIDIKLKTDIDYICDIGVATSTDGVHFSKDTVNSPFFRNGEDKKYCYADVNVVKSKDTYYLFCNQWYWPNTEDHAQNGTFLATSKDLLHWTKKGIVFPKASRTHRNAVVLQNGNNEAVKINGKYVMYINDNLMAYSKDMLHWESKEVKTSFPGGECCFALAEYDNKDPNKIILFTGGNHTGHFYAIGQVLFSKSNPEHPIEYLPKPALYADSTLSYEHGFSATEPNKLVSIFADCIFFNGLTLYKDKWWFYYGGSEYYTCLATAPFKK